MRDTDIPDDAPEPPRIRMLRRLVTLLTLTLTLGMMVVVGLLVWRLTTSAPRPALPEAVALPQGERLTGYAQNPDWTVLITEDADGTQRVHIVAPGETAPHQSVTITPLAK